jgi:hypothetical protein
MPLYVVCTLHSARVGLSYTTVIDDKPFIFNLRYYREYDAEHRWEGNSTIASGTIRF